MKKTIKILALALVATFTLTLLVACGLFPSTNPEKTKKVLEGKGYSVKIETDQKEFAYLYETYGLKEGDIKASLSATNGKEDDEGLYVFIIYCKNTAAAKKLWENNDFKKSLTGNLCGRDGSLIYFGDKQAWEDSH